MRSKYSVALLLAAAACGGDSTTPTASGVFPAEGFTGRSVRVEISGDATTWKDGATVDFGAGVTVNSVDVASPTDLFAEITIDPAAAAGKTDVTVTNSGKKYTLTKAFELVSPTPISFSGDVAQGGVPFFTIGNLDFSHQFDPTQDQNTGEFTNTTITGPAGAQIVLSSVTPFEIQGRVLLDINATPGPLTLMVGNGSNATTSIPGTLDVKPRTPTPFTSPLTISLAEHGSSNLYSFSNTGATIVHYSLTGTAPDSAPVSEVLGAGGTWAADAIGASPAVLEQGGMGYLLVESFGNSADTVTLKGAVESLTSAAEGNDNTNGTAAGALVASSIPFRQTGGILSSASDVDVIKFTIAGADVNKKAHINTDLGGNPNVDSSVNVVNCTTNASMTGGVQDNTLCPDFFNCMSFNEDVTTSALPAGTYCIQVSAGPGWASSDENYVAAFWLE